jgi:hypothetical protein
MWLVTLIRDVLGQDAGEWLHPESAKMIKRMITIIN